MKKNVLQLINGALTPVSVDMTAEEEATLLANAPDLEPELLSDAQRMDEIESAMMELAAMIGGAE